MAAGEDCVVIGLESFSMGLSVWVAGNTVYAQMHARTWRIEAFANLRLLVYLLLLLILLLMFRVS